jgi:thymidylate kinase
MRVDFPGYVLFEGLDLAGKTSTAKKVVDLINNEKKVRVSYLRGFFSDVNLEYIENVSSSLDSQAKEKFFTELYLKDKKGPIISFDAIQITDRYFPSIIFYGHVRNGTPIYKYNLQEDFLLPRHVVLLESDYESKKKRFPSRAKMNFLEKLMFESKSNHDNFTSIYRRIIELMNVPFSIIDTSSTTLDEVARQIFYILKKSNALVDRISFGNLLADTQYVLHRVTVQKYARQIKKGQSIEPPVVLKVNNESGPLYVIRDGRHRAMAYYTSGIKEVPSYVNYESGGNKFSTTDFISLINLRMI